MFSSLVEYQNLVFVPSFDYTKEELENFKGKDNFKVVICRDMLLNSTAEFEKFCSDFAGREIIVIIGSENDFQGNRSEEVFDPAELPVLNHNQELIAKQGGRLFLSDNLLDEGDANCNKIPIERAIDASKIINDWVEQIDGARVSGRPLSNLEKFLFAYLIVTEFKYQNSLMEPNESKSIARILTGDKIVCVGYARLLSELCNRLGLPCKTQALYRGLPTKFMTTNHENCITFLVDPFYDVDGLFMSDACWDSFKDAGHSKTINHALLTFSDLPLIFSRANSLTFKSDESEKFNKFRFFRKISGAENDALFCDSDSPAQWAASALKNGFFNGELSNFLEVCFEMAKNLKPNILLSTHIRSEQEAYLLVKDLAISCFAGENSLNEFSAQRNLETLESLIYLLISKFGTERAEFVQKVVQGIQSSDYLENPELLNLLSASHDRKVIDRADEEFEKAKQTAKYPSLRQYFEALTNVFIARGNSQNEAKNQAKKIIEQSVEYASKFWQLSSEPENPFAREAAREQQGPNLGFEFLFAQ